MVTVTRSAAYPVDISLGGHWAMGSIDGFHDKIIDSLNQFSGRWTPGKFGFQHHTGV